MVQQIKLGELPIKRVTLKRLKPAKYNPRVTLKPGDSGFEKLVKSIDQFGLVEPIVWNKRSGNVVGGHQRLSVLKYLKVTSTDVVVVDLDKQAEKTLNIALNKVTGEWDMDKLAIVLEELRVDDAVDELTTGFDEDEIAQLTEGLSDPDSGGSEPGYTAERRMTDKLEFRLMVRCASEKEIIKLLKRLEGEGFVCQPVIS